MTIKIAAKNELMFIIGMYLAFIDMNKYIRWEYTHYRLIIQLEIGDYLCKFVFICIHYFGWYLSQIGPNIDSLEHRNRK